MDSTDPQQTINIQSALAALRSDHSALDYRLTFVEERKAGRPRPLTTRLYYVTLGNGLPTIAELAEHLRWEIVTFCLPRSERDQLSREMNNLSETERIKRVVRQDNKARKLFALTQTKLNRKGECAELLLYALLEWAYGAPQIVSKMHLKTNRNMPVHGADGIHLRFDETAQELELIFGESKGYATFETALRSALDSIKDFVTNRDKLGRELEIAQDHIDLGNAEPDTVLAIKTYINPYTRERLKRRETHACLLAYNDDAYKHLRSVALSDRETWLFNEMRRALADRQEAIESLCSKDPHVDLNFLFFLVPVESIDTLRSAFSKEAGLDAF